MRSFLLVSSLLVQVALSQVRSGAEVFLRDRLDLVTGKRVGIVTNHSALLPGGVHLVDSLRNCPGVRITALFGPEHGIRGDAPDGRTVKDSTDPATGIPVYSLYGAISKPTPDMLRNVDVLLYDIQDVGARFYTFISTLALAEEAAAEKGIPFIVLDRPNPIRGTWVEGPVRLDSLRSFVGYHPLPIAHGMTVGELAMMFNGEGWLKGGVDAKLTIIRCEGWQRSMWYDQTGLAWVKPSPNMATLGTATVYPGTCLFEGTNLSEGRGTEHPFEYIGAPYVDGARWAAELNAAGLPGVTFEPVTFTPVDIPRVASKPKYQGSKCNGVAVRVTDRNAFEPVRTAVVMLSAARRLFGRAFEWRTASIDRLAGTPVLRTAIDAGTSPDAIMAGWEHEVEAFRDIRSGYLLY